MAKKELKETEEPKKTSKKDDKENEESNLEDGIEEIERAREINEDEDTEEIDVRSFHSFMGNWTGGGRALPTLDMKKMPISEIDLEETAANAPVQTEQRVMRYEPRTTTNYDVIAEEETRRYEIERSGMNPPVLTPDIGRGSGPRMLNPLTGRSIPKDGMNPDMVELKRETGRRRLPFEGDTRKYKEVKL